MPHRPRDNAPARAGRVAVVGRKEPETIADSEGVTTSAGGRAMPVVQTFELYLTGPDGVRTFEALTCQPLEIITRVRLRLVEEGAGSAEVWQAGQRLFILAGASDDP